MRYLTFAFAVLIMGVCLKTVNMASIESTNILDDILVYPVPVPEATKVIKREGHIPDTTNEFLIKKLEQQREALEYLVKHMDHYDEMTRQLIEHLSKTLDKPKLPEKIETKKQEHSGRRSNLIEEKTKQTEQADHPVLRLGKNISIYGRLAKDLFMKEIESGTDPTPLVEKHPNEQASKYSRRSMGDSGTEPNHVKRTELSPWCEAAMLCNKTGESICGFDDKYGSGKFEDICHMLLVNCYYKYNFALAHTCHPII